MDPAQYLDDGAALLALVYTTMVDMATGGFASYHEVVPKIQELLNEPLVFRADRIGEGRAAEEGYAALVALAGGPAQPRDPHAARPAPALPDTSGLPPGLRLAPGPAVDNQLGGMMDQQQ